MKAHLKVSLPVIIFSIVALFAAFIARWYFHNFEKTSYERSTGYSQEARRNPFLAAQRFLRLRGIQLETRNNYKLFEEELGQYDTVIINSSRVGMSSRIKEIMIEWVKQGGNLVLLATEAFDYELESSRDIFLDELGLRYYPDNYVPESDDEALSEFTFSEFDESTQVHFNSSGYIEDTSGEASFVAGTEYADQLIQYQLESGLITITVDFSIWHNNRIDQFDHAMFLVQLIGNSDKTWLLYSRVQPSLLSLAFKHATTVSISVLAILLSIFLSSLWRKGAKTEDDKPINREIMQHVHAAAEFDYRLDKGQQLIQSLMDIIHQQMTRVSYGYARLTPAKQLDKIAQHTGIERDRISSLFEIENQNHESFLEKIILIQQIRKHL
ncbi:DUF4350 domain-containing protein [Aliikangiella sp. G2MR2-5]|uniref:DUF4350 domain-containing protein n=1 Tax=Aliikangiella sp. G2MR2-5 TaxID=2788943 RepID=UPI0018A900BB|nr:DUF4350 domain-containing protein [Aliikangiella sp. G2MR2-5]